jgi:hypothetical protein
MYSGNLKRVRAALPGCTVEARLVYDGDDFEATFGDQPTLRHVPQWGSGRGQPVACYAIVTEANGTKHREVMEVEEINAIRDRSQGYNVEKPSGPWHTDYGEMAKKTVLNRLSKLLPQAQGRPALASDADDHGGATDEVEVWDATTVPLPPDTPDTPVAAEDTDVQVWKGRLRDLRDAIGGTLTKLGVEEEWENFNGTYTPPDDVVTAAKGLIDKRLAEMEEAAKAYEEAKG